MIQNSSITKNSPLFCPFVINPSSTFSLWQPLICSLIPGSFGFHRISYQWNHTIFGLVGVHWALWMCKCMCFTKFGSCQPFFLQVFFLHKSLFSLLGHLWHKCWTFAIILQVLKLCSFFSLSLHIQIVQLLLSFLQLHFPFFYFLHPAIESSEFLVDI